jgi:hypothetical protein
MPINGSVPRFRNLTKEDERNFIFTEDPARLENHVRSNNNVTDACGISEVSPPLAP